MTEAGCVSDSQVLGLMSGDLAGGDRAKVLGHLDQCQLCRTVVATLAKETPTRTDARGEQLGPFSLLKRIGSGGMAEVFLAEGADGERCVLKRLRADRDNAEFQRRFRQEARLLTNLDHPNIGKVLDYREIDGQLILVLELIEGIDFKLLLGKFKQAGAIAPAALAVELVAQAALGLGFAHRATDAQGKRLELIHRDVSPGNLMVDAQGVVKVIDFGMAQAATNEATKTGMVVGKLQYFAPEQATGDRIDSRCDVFALGLVFQEFLTGRPSYRAKSNRQLEKDVASGHTVPEPPDDVWVLPELWEISRQCVAVNPGERFQTMEALEQQLRRAQQSLSLTLSADALRDLTR